MIKKQRNYGGKSLLLLLGVYMQKETCNRLHLKGLHVVVGGTHNNVNGRLGHSGQRSLVKVQYYCGNRTNIMDIQNNTI